jgi:hypothetical protein
MKLIFAILMFSTFSFAQKMAVKVDDVNMDENTTIEIKKGSNSSNSPLYEITQGEDSIEGDAAPLLKEARKNWKKACEDWKKEFKDLNKDNSILSMNCGPQNCSTQAMETVCNSKASYKLKVKIN